MPRLLPTEATILACTELRAKYSIEQIRKATGLREHKIRYALNKMLTRGLLRYMPYINMGALGLSEYNIFFSISTPQPTIRTRFLTHIKKLKNITWIAEMGGEYQYAISIIAKSSAHLQDIISQMVTPFGNIFVDKVACTQFSYSLLPRKYLCTKDFKLEPLVNRVMSERVAIDVLDQKIISELVASNYESHRQIAMKLNIPLSTLDLRVRELEKKGVIQGYIFDLDISQIDIQHFKLLIFARGLSASLQEGIRTFASQHPNIVYLVECFGNWDFEVGVEVYQSKDVASIVNDLQDRFGSAISSIVMLHKFSEIKSVTFPIELAL